MERFEKTVEIGVPVVTFECTITAPAKATWVAVPSAVPLASLPVDPSAAPSTELSKPVEKKPEPAAEENLHLVKSPIVGTFYESPSPGAPPFVKPGDNVAAGQVLCIVEAMKLMNEIESDVAGEIVKMLVTNNQPIEYGQALYAIRPNA